MSVVMPSDLSVRRMSAVQGQVQSFFPTPRALDKLAASLDKLADALQNLADAIGDLQGGGNTVPTLPPASGDTAPAGQVIAGSGRIWGDPHFIGADGGKYDVQGEAGKTYNLLSDQGLQVNGRFDSWGSRGATVVGEVGITLSKYGDVVGINKDGKGYVNGKEIKDGQTVTLDDGTTVKRNGKNFEVKTAEWTLNIQTRGDHINMDVKTENAVADGVKPHGLLGQSFDGDGIARNGDKGAGAQGGGAIEDKNGNISKAGDKNTVAGYEVGGLFDTNFETHNVDPFSSYGIANNDYTAETFEKFNEIIGNMQQITVGMNYGKIDYGDY